MALVTTLVVSAINFLYSDTQKHTILYTSNKQLGYLTVFLPGSKVSVHLKFSDNVLSTVKALFGVIGRHLDEALSFSKM